MPERIELNQRMRTKFNQSRMNGNDPRLTLNMAMFDLTIRSEGPGISTENVSVSRDFLLTVL